VAEPPLIPYEPEFAMLDTPKPRRLHEPITVSLEELVPQDHFYRDLEVKLDLGFVRDWTREFYAERSQPSIDHLGPGRRAAAPGSRTVRIETGRGHRGS
jgi:hypothetical protein